MSRSRQLSPLPDDLPQAVRTLLGELRLLRDRSGYDLRALASKTHASRSSWGRWLSGETWIPREAVASMAELCAGDAGRLDALWQRADEERRTRPGPNVAANAAAVDGETVTAGASTTILREDPEPPLQSARRGRLIFSGVVLACAVVGGAIGLGLGLSLRSTPAQPARPHTPWLSRQEVLSRVQMWHPHSDQRIPYSQDGLYQGYRTDGSGYASMALGLPVPGPNSPDLASGQYSHLVAPAELRPGDLVINPTGDAGTRQVAIFDKWADGPHTRYWVYQQRRGYGTDHLILSYPLGANSQYHAYRPLNLHDAGASQPSG